MNTDQHGWDQNKDGIHCKNKKVKFVAKILFFSFLSVFIRVHPWLIDSAFAAQETPTVDKALDLAAQELQKAKDETQKLKDFWDKAKLETTLYDKRAKRAYQKWLKSAKALKEQAKAQKDQADLELQLALEKRKLAYNEWQASQLRLLSHESQVKALDQEKQNGSIRLRIKQLEDKIGQQSTAHK